MDKNQFYIQNVKVEEVPWHRIDTAYGSAAHFPEYFQQIGEMADMAEVKEALSEIAGDIEHQSTLWQSTPFAMIFLVRLLGKAIPEMESNALAKFIVEYLLDLFGVIAECCLDVLDDEDMEAEEPFPCFTDLLDEKYLLPEEYDEDQEADDRYEEGVLDDMFYSIWYYSYQVLQESRPMLKKLENTSVHKEVQTLEGLL